MLINLSVNPTYLCNFRCNFCYLTVDQLSHKKKINLNHLKEKLTEIAGIYTINDIDLYGGEIGMLPDDYLNELMDLLKSSGKRVNIITNLSLMKPIFYDPEIELSVSWDSDLRQSSEVVLKNIINIKRDVSILMLVSKSMTEWSDAVLLNTINQLNNVQNIISVELKPYSQNQANQEHLGFNDFENFVKRWLNLELNFQFINKEKLEQVLSGSANSFSDDHLYITPNGNYAVLDFDKNDYEFFKELNSLSEYFDWMNLEKMKVSNNKFCSNCKYLGHCLSEHLRHVENLNNSCNGFYNLIEWYKEKNAKRI